MTTFALYKSSTSVAELCVTVRFSSLLRGEQADLSAPHWLRHPLRVGEAKALRFGFFGFAKSKQCGGVWLLWLRQINEKRMVSFAPPNH